MNYQAWIRSENKSLHDIPVISFHSQNEAFNSDYAITIVINMSHYLAADQLLLANICLLLQHDRQQHYWHGCLSQVTAVAKNASGYAYELTLSSPWYVLKRQPKNRVYVNETISSLIKTIFTDYPALINKVKIKFATDHPIAYAAQYQETDYALLNRWFIHFGIITKIEQYKDRSIFIITDKHQTSGIKTVAFVNNTGMETLSTRIFEWQRHEFLLSKQLGWQKQLFTAKTDGLCLNVDDVIQLTHHPSQDAQQLTRIYLVDHVFEQGSYHNQVLLCGIEKQYAKPCHLTQLPQLYRQLLNYGGAEVFGGAPRTNQHPIAANGVLSAIIDAPAETIKLDAAGCYRVKFDFADNCYAQGCNSPPVKLIKSTVGKQWGMHWPLPGQTKVAIGHIDGDLDRPFILGVLPDELTPGPVTQHNQLKTILHSANNAGVLFDDAELSVLQLETQQQQQVIRFSNSQHEGKLSLDASKGCIDLQAVQQMDWYCAAKFQLQCADITVNVTYNSDIISHHGELLYQSADAINLQAGQYLQMDSERDLLVHSADAMCCSVHEQMDLQAQHGDIQVQAKNGSIYIQAASGASMLSEDGSITLSVGKARCEIAQNGSIQLSANNIHFCAKSVNLPENSRINSV